MDFPKSSQSLDDSSFPWRSTVIYAACAHTLLEHYINIRQAKRLRPSLPVNGENSPPKIFSDINYHVWNAFYRFLLVLAIIGFEGVPKLWLFVKGVQETHLPALYDSDWGRSYLFLVACYCIYPVLNIPHFLYRVFVSGEGVWSYFVSRRKRNSLVYAHIAEGRPVAIVVVLTAIGTLYYKIFEKKLDGSFVLWVAGFQAAFTILRPMLSQPRGKSLDVMWDGEKRDAIHELATIAGFPIKEIYVVEGALDRVHNGVRTCGWPRKTYITVHKDVLEQCTTDDITALLAQELGAWKHGNGMRLFSVGQMLFTQAACTLLLFLKQSSVYESFGFHNEYPLVGAIALFAVGIAPPLTASFKLHVNFLRRRNQFMADKYAAVLGYSHPLGLALNKVDASINERCEMDSFYSLYYNAVPLIGERVAALEMIEEKQDGEMKGAIWL